MFNPGEKVCGTMSRARGVPEEDQEGGPDVEGAGHGVPQAVRPVPTGDQVRNAAEALQDYLEAVVKAKFSYVMSNRERFLMAWVAETGIHPSNAVLVEREMGTGAVEVSIYPRVLGEKCPTCPRPVAPKLEGDRCACCGRLKYGGELKETDE